MTGRERARCGLEADDLCELFVIDEPLVMVGKHEHEESRKYMVIYSRRESTGFYLESNYDDEYPSKEQPIDAQMGISDFVNDTVLFAGRLCPRNLKKALDILELKDDNLEKDS